MIEKDDILSVSFLKKQNFTGSYRGMRYILMHEEDRIRAVVWPQPMSYALSAEEDRLTADFDFSEEGRLAAIDWLNETYEAGKERWVKAGFEEMLHRS